MDWLWIGYGLAMDWRWIGDGLAMDWRWIGDRLAMDWLWIGRIILRRVRIVLRRDTSVGFPVVHLFPGYLREWPPIGEALA